MISFLLTPPQKGRESCHQDVYWSVSAPLPRWYRSRVWKRVGGRVNHSGSGSADMWNARESVCNRGMEKGPGLSPLDYLR